VSQKIAILRAQPGDKGSRRLGDTFLLRDLVVVFAVGVFVVALLQRVGVPSIAGFIIAGLLLGPKSLGLIQSTHQVETIAEVGVVFLLFGIGLELSLDRLRRLWRPVLIGGALQVGLTLAIVTAIARLLGQPPGRAVFLGCMIAVSSTAIVLRGLETRGEIDAPHGRLTLGILVFQDLSVVPMMLAIPLLAATSAPGSSPWLALPKSFGVLAGVLIAARIVVPRVLHLVAHTRQKALFLLTVFLVCLGTAWIVSHAGVSLALGAFLAGLVVAGSQYRHQALADLIPFREVFTSFFFVSMGMLLDPVVVAHNLGSVLGLFSAIVLGKFVIVVFMGMIMRLPLRVCVLAGAALAQGGEFSFILSRAAEGTGLFEGPLAANITAAIVLSMLVTPVALILGPHIAAGLGRSRVLTQMMGVRTCADIPEACTTFEGHVIIAGYGIAGRDLAHALRDRRIPYVMVDLNPENVRRADRAGEPVFFGDVTSAKVLEYLGVERAAELVLVINDPNAAATAIRSARSIAPDLAILVRTRYVGEVEDLLRAGATDAIAAELEASAEVTARVLERHGVHRDDVDEHLCRIRKRRSETGLSTPGEESEAGR